MSIQFSQREKATFSKKCPFFINNLLMLISPTSTFKSIRNLRVSSNELKQLFRLVIKQGPRSQDIFTYQTKQLTSETTDLSLS